MNPVISVVVFLILTLISVTPAIAEPTSYLSVSHRVYDFLDRMEHHYFISGTRLGTKPFTRAEAARLLFSISEKSTPLSEVDKEELLCLMDEFKPDFFNRHGLVWDDKGPVERIPGFLKDFVYRNRRNLFSTNGNNYSLYFDPVIVRKSTFKKLHESSSEDSVIYTSENGFKIHGTIGDHLGFRIDVRDSKEQGSRDYPEKTSTTMAGTGFASFKGDRAEFDETSAHLAYSHGPFLLSYGRGENIWGRGRKGTLVLSEYSAPYDMLRFETGFWRLKFMFFASEIEQYPPIAKFNYNNTGVVSDSVVVKKHLTGHRVEIDVTNRINIGLYEAIIYGGRWDLSYLNPLMFFKGADHANGDHDNAVMGMDFRIFVHRSHSIYGEFFIDDITTTKLGTDWYGNKLAYQLGSFIVEPFALKDTDTRIEYTRISPWVYTHRYPINTYTNYGDVLGHPIGPNSDELLMEIRKRFTRRLHTSLFFSRRRHGKNPDGENVGGNPLEGFKNGDSKKAGFLAGNVEKAYAFSVNVSYEIFWQFFLKIGYTYEDINDDNINIFRLSLCLNE